MITKNGLAKPPLLWPAISTTEADSEAIKELGASLHGLYFNVEAWDAALQLYKFSKNPPVSISREVASKWKFIAIYQCVMQADYFRERLQFLPGRKGMKCQSISTTMNNKLFEDAVGVFKKEFPNIKALRHAVAHFGMVESLPEHHAPDGVFPIYKIESNDVFKAPFKGVVNELAITDATLQKLTHITTMIFESLAPSAKELERLGYAD
jgi:hypothetical protein